MSASGLTLLNLERPSIHAGTGVDVNTTTVDVTNTAAMEDFFMSVRTHSGQFVGPEQAKRCAAVLAIMRGLMEDTSALPLPLYKRAKNGDEIAPDHNVHRILNVAPNQIMTPMEIREHIMLDLMTTGNFFNLKNEDPNNPGAVDNIWPLEARYVSRLPFQTMWLYSDPTTGRSGEFTADSVWRGSILSTNGLDGVAITLLCREAIGLLIAAEEQGARLFKQGVQTDLALETPNELDKEEIEQLRKAFMARHSGSQNSWLPMLLQGGLKANKIGLTAQESQYIESRKFQIGDIARAFRYPEVLLGNSTGKTSTYASAEQFFESYTKHTLLPWAVRIEQTIHRDLLTVKEQAQYFVKHDFSQLLRANQAARFDAWNKAISGGWMQPEEARRNENLPYKPGLDYFNRAKNMDSLGGATTPAPTDQSALARRVAVLILQKEHKALIGQKQDPAVFYGNFGTFVQSLTGADALDVLNYKEMRRSTEDRFSVEAQERAVSVLSQLCKG
jgi:HK97 family phage portal protein